MAQVVDLQLARMDASPWGFRLQGGTDFGTPLLIQRVNTSSPAECSGLQAGDVILKVNGESVDNLKHKQVQDKIIRSGNRFNVTVSRGGVLSQTLTRPNKAPNTPKTPRPNPEGREWNSTLEADRAGAANNAEDFTKMFMAQLQGQEPPVVNNPNPIGPDFAYTSNQIGHNNFVEKSGNSAGGTFQGFNKPQQQPQQIQQQQQVYNNNNDHQQQQTPIKKVASMMNSKQYNSPHHLYSDDNLEEVLTQQAEVLANGVKGIEIKDDNSGAGFFSSKKPGNYLNSATLRMVQELDSKGPEPEPGRDIEPSRAPAHFKGLANRNIQSASFLQLQKALEEEEGTASPRTCPSPGGSWNRRDSSGYGRNISTPTQISQGNSRPESTDVIDANRNKKAYLVGGNLVWPPQNSSSPGPTATPMYMNPGGSRNQSPAPRFRVAESPARTSSPGAGMNGNSSRNGTPVSTLGRPQNGHSAAANNNATAQNGVHVVKIQQQQPQQSQQSAQEEWSKILDAHPLGVAPNADVFTKQFMDQNFGQQPQMMSSTVTTNSNSFQQKMFSNQPTAPMNQPSAAPMNNQQSAPGSGSGQNLTAPKRGKGVLTQQRPENTPPKHASSNANGIAPTNGGISPQDSEKLRGILGKMSSSLFEKGVRFAADKSVAPICSDCYKSIDRGPFITALGKTWCPNHFLCNMESCRRSLQETGFVEEQGLLYCEDCYAKYLAPDCDKCRTKIVGNCLKAMGKKFHPECFNCAYCGKLFSNSPFYLEDGLPYCEEDWNELFTTKCVACCFPIEAGDRWVEAINNNYHSQCFNCTLCKKNLEGQSFFVKGGKPFCKGHAKI